MDKNTFAEIISSAWYIYEGLTKEELIEKYGYKKSSVDYGIKLSEALEKKQNN